MLDKNIVGIELNFEIAFKELIDSEYGIPILNKIESEVIELCNRNGIIFKGGLGSFKKEQK